MFLVSLQLTCLPQSLTSSGKYWTPEMLEAHTIAHGSPEVTAAPEVDMEHSSTESMQEDVPEPEPAKPTKDVKQPKDFTKVRKAEVACL